MKTVARRFSHRHGVTPRSVTHALIDSISDCLTVVFVTDMIPVFAPSHGHPLRACDSPKSRTRRRMTGHCTRRAAALPNEQMMVCGLWLLRTPSIDAIRTD